MRWKELVIIPRNAGGGWQGAAGIFPAPHRVKLFSPINRTISRYYCLLVNRRLPSGFIMRKSLIVAILPLLFQGFAARAQEKVISGVVRDEHTGENIPFAAVYFPGTSRGTTTDARGKYSCSLRSFPSDSLAVRVIGYPVVTRRINPAANDQRIDFSLSRNDLPLKEFVIHAGVDPALILLRKIIRHKPENNPDRLQSYKCRVYNKLEVDLDRINKNKFIHSKLFSPFAFVLNNVDSAAGEEPFLPIFLTETLSDYYYQRNPEKEKELIIASRRSGIKNGSLTQFLGSMYQQVNVYNNFIPVFGKEFASPISDFARIYYDYKIVDTQFIDHRKCFHVNFEPRRKGENTFFGDFWVNDTTFALQKITLQVSSGANLNFARRVSLVQEFTPLNDTLWFLTKNKFIADFSVAGSRSLALTGRKTTLFTMVSVGDTTSTNVFKDSRYGGGKVFVLPGAPEKDTGFWTSNRPEPLSKNERSVYEMTDSLQKMPLFREYSNIIRFATTGRKAFGPVDFGPYYYLFNVNSLEKYRVRLGVETNTRFSKALQLSGYLAYGFGDRSFKGEIAGLWLLKSEPRMYLYGSYTHDLDNGAIRRRDVIGMDNLFALAIRKPGVSQKFVMVNEKRLEFYKEWPSGFSQQFSVVNTEFSPYAPLPVEKYFSASSRTATEPLNDFQLGVALRFAYHERFFDRNNFRRLSLGSKYPVLALNYAIGLKGIFNSNYHYQKMGVDVSDKINMAPLGKLHLNIYGEKIYGTLPYLLLKIHPGNDLYYYNRYAFNMMNRYEFISDQYAGLNIEHDIGGGVFNYLPGIRRLKLRQFWTAKAVVGRLSDANRRINLHNGYLFRTLDSKPYVELGTGVENILHFIRIDLVWRVSSPPPQPAFTDRRFGIFGSFRLQF